MKSEFYLKQCCAYIANLVTEVETLNSLNYYDINISSETFFMKLLNLVNSYNLKNINNEKNNSASIDLYDLTNRVAVQVTSDKSSAKIKKTIDKFINNKLYEAYDNTTKMDKQDEYQSFTMANMVIAYNLSKLFVM